MATPTPTDPALLPQKLRRLSSRAQKLEDSRADRLIASKRSGEVISRESLAALYALAAGLHSPRLVFHAKAIETSREKHITTEQIWGQLSVLLRPVLRRLQDNVRTVERFYGSAGGRTREKGSIGTNPHCAPLSADSNEAETEQDGENKSARASSGSSVVESDLDEEITQLLKERQRRVAAQNGKVPGKGTTKEDWRFAFGKGCDDDDDNDDWENSGDGKKRRGSLNSEEEEELGLEDDSHARRAQKRNKRAIMEADAEDDDIRSSEAAEEELAALREMYGEDFDDDGKGLEAIDEEDLMIDRLSQDEDGDREDENDENLFDEQLDGARAHARGNMLNDEMGDFEEDGSPDAAESDVDEELRQALADPNLTALEKERLIEKKHVENLEQKRLYSTDWAMAGETAANKRPREALLDVQDLEFDYGMKALPVITAEFTAKLEDRIRRRIVEKQFDDVERHTSLTTPDTLVTTKRDAVLDSAKSKLSLMDLYEKAYLDKVRAAEEAKGEAPTQAEPLTEIEKDELRAIQMWRRLAQHLDALSNFYFTPKPVQQELEARVRAVERQAPAIALESVGNFAASREDALAPQDLYRGSRHKYVDAGTNELRPKERRALRRAKKDQGKKTKDIKAKLHARKRPQSQENLNK
ncbi:unnamed protein product [Phytomonas sp. Hart1]|nr:unnamed protein product [Phytomonas sp. Hart1]|eukprot:CCW67423.1 unnamed protein product [Phytomonas sp. isolate Hart1]